eukprot:162553-Rhodomonas_salina.5
MVLLCADSVKNADSERENESGTLDTRRNAMPACGSRRGCFQAGGCHRAAGGGLCTLDADTAEEQLAGAQHHELKQQGLVSAHVTGRRALVRGPLQCHNRPFSCPDQVAAIGPAAKRVRLGLMGALREVERRGLLGEQSKLETRLLQVGGVVGVVFWGVLARAAALAPLLLLQQTGQSASSSRERAEQSLSRGCGYNRECATQHRSVVSGAGTESSPPLHASSRRALHRRPASLPPTRTVSSSSSLRQAATPPS